jgi:hypothetical protein
MSAIHRIGFVVLLLVVACVLGTTFAGAQVERTAVQKWEHKAFSGLTDDAGNDWGNDGWELVAVTSRTDRGIAAGFYFKRPKR